MDETKWIKCRANGRIRYKDDAGGTRIQITYDSTQDAFLVRIGKRTYSFTPDEPWMDLYYLPRDTECKYIDKDDIEYLVNY